MFVQKKIPLSLSYDDVLLIPQYSTVESRNDVDLTVKLTPHISLKFPVIPANMSDVTNENMAIAIAKLGGIGVLPRFVPLEIQTTQVMKVKKAGVLTGAAVGIRNGVVERAKALVTAGADILFLDVAHGHMQKTIEITKFLKALFKNSVDLVSGNAATYEAANDLFLAGADCVKVGIGPGTICTTRIETGSGVAQITAILDCARAARKHKKTIIADGGTKNSGDIVKALAAGASAVMAGSQFAGCEEAPGDKVEKDGIFYKRYNASTSITEKKNHIEQNGNDIEKHYIKQIEGVESMVPYKGFLSEMVEKTSANIRSGFAYSGAKNINELWKNAKFTQITTAGLRESAAHDVLLVNNS